MLAWVYATAFLSVCLCVCLCVTRVLCIKTAKCFVKILSPPYNPIILVFHHQESLLNSNDFTPNGVDKYKGVRKLDDFWPVSWCILETVQDTATVTKRSNRKPYPSYWMVSSPMTLSDPNPQFQGQPTVRRLISCKQCMLCPATWRLAGFSAIAELRLVQLQWKETTEITVNLHDSDSRAAMIKHLAVFHSRCLISILTILLCDTFNNFIITHMITVTLFVWLTIHLCWRVLGSFWNTAIIRRKQHSNNQIYQRKLLTSVNEKSCFTHWLLHTYIHAMDAYGNKIRE